MNQYFLSVVFFLLSGIALSAVPLASYYSYKTWPVYLLSMLLLGVGIACVVWR